MELMRSARANGLVAYRVGRVVGWCHAAPKTELLNLPTGSEADVGAIVCFVVAPDARRQGIATALLAASVNLAAPYDDMDYGPFISATFVAPTPKNNLSQRGIAV